MHGDTVDIDKECKEKAKKKRDEGLAGYIAVHHLTFRLIENPAHVPIRLCGEFPPVSNRIINLAISRFTIVQEMYYGVL